jgi:hypothetical protein
MGRCRIGPIWPVDARRPPIDPVSNDGKAGSRGGRGGRGQPDREDSGTSWGGRYVGIDVRGGESVVIGISCLYVLLKQLPIISSLLLSFLCVPADDGVEPPSRWWEIDNERTRQFEGEFPSSAPFASKGWRTRI